MNLPNTDELIRRAMKAHVVIPGFNIPYLEMMEPVVRALHDTNSVGLIMVARLEWVKFRAKSLKAIRDEYLKVGDPAHTRLHLDHLPVIDEDLKRVDFEHDIAEAVDLGYQSVMIDGSRLPLDENIACTKKAADIAHKGSIPIEAELGAVLGHESGPLPPYEELFTSRRGFTSPEEASRFVRESGTDWLSVAIGNIHGAISDAGRQKEKPHARIDLEHLERLRDATGIPLVLHGGTGIASDYVKAAFQRGIAKINVATAIRQPFERVMNESGNVTKAQEAVYQTMLTQIRDELGIENSADKLTVPSGE